jgi:uncharacterized protein
MLLIELAKLGPEGLDLDVALTAGEVHVQGEDSFRLESGRLTAHVEKDDEGSVHVKGHLATQLGLECGRCLEPFIMPLDQDLDLFFLPHQDDPDAEDDEDEVELSESDLVVAYYRGDRLDLGEVLREQLFLSLPMKRVCQEACQGLCPTCGTNRNRSQCGCAVADTVDNTDPRLASLKKLLGN